MAKQLSPLAMARIIDAVIKDYLPAIQQACVEAVQAALEETPKTNADILDDLIDYTYRERKNALHTKDYRDAARAEVAFNVWKIMRRVNDAKELGPNA